MEPLTIGRAAPEIRGARWLRSQPIDRFEEGHVYVLEFWATWCGPCRASIPKLSQLAAKVEGRATVIGVNVFEKDQGTEAGFAVVEQFVKNMGERMRYPVLVDGPDQFMAEQWMRRSGRQGIPSAFLVDQNGILVWIGHPMQGLDAAVEAVLAGNTPQTHKDEPNAEKSKEHQKRLGPFFEATSRKDYSAALAEIEKVRDLPGYPKDWPTALQFQAAAMCGKDEIVQEALRNFDKGELATTYAHMIAMSEQLRSETYRLGISFLEARMPEEDPYRHLHLHILGRLQFNAGNRLRALELMREAIAACDQDPKNGAVFRPLCEAHLERILGGG